MSAWQRSLAREGYALHRLLAAAAALVVLAWGVSWLLRPEEVRIRERIDGARSALVEGRDAEFLAVFADDVDYLGGKGRADLERDLRRWRQVGRLQVWFPGEPAVDVGQDQASVAIDAMVGPSPLQGVPVGVQLSLEKQDAGWRVTAFSWSRR